MLKQARFRLEAAVFGLLLLIARVVPRRVLLAFGSLAGSAGYLLDGRHRRISVINLRNAYGDEMTAARARKITRACWRHFGRITLDTLSFPGLDEKAAGRVVRYEGLEHIRAAYDKGRGVLLFSGHFGHWELTALMQGFLGLPLDLVTRPLDNPYLERMLARLRSGSGNRVVHKRNAVREMMRALHAGRGVAIVIDQDARGSGVFVPFFGRPASTTPTLALLAQRTGAAVIPTFCVPEAGGVYRVIYEPEVRLDSSGDRAEDVRRLTAECTAIIERWVRRHPELWLWMHRRWKTEPASPEPPGESAA